jgi:hypothetical protein
MSHPDNPIRALLKLLPISMLAFERKHGISHSALMQLTAGNFERPLDRVDEALNSELLDLSIDMDEELEAWYGTTDITTAYTQWRIAERIRWGHENEWPKIKPRSKRSPVANFIDDGWGGATTFSKALKVPYAAALSWYRADRAATPKAIVEAFSDAGGADVLVDLEIAELKYQMRQAN